MSNNNDTFAQNRSEIIFLYDAQDCNPNGDPLSASNSPRIDPHTQQAISTDVRLKRYIRDQMDADGHGVFISSTGDENGNAVTREALVKSVLDVESVDDVDDGMLDAFLDAATDVRYFGSTLTIDGDDDELVQAVRDAVPRKLKGAVQFSPARTLNAVQMNEESKKLTSVISSQKGNKQGTMADDLRIKYGLLAYHGVIDENVAATTHLTQTDVNRLDTLLWRAIKNQANSRSKRGQEPRGYVRVEYESDRYHIGLNNVLTIDESRSTPDAEMRTIRDVCICIDDLVDVLAAHADHIETVHINTDHFTRLSYDGTEGDGTLIADALRETLGADAVREIDVYDEYKDTLPKEN